MPDNRLETIPSPEREPGLRPEMEVPGEIHRPEIADADSVVGHAPESIVDKDGRVIEREVPVPQTSEEHKSIPAQPEQSQSKNPEKSAVQQLKAYVQGDIKDASQIDVHALQESDPASIAEALFGEPESK